MATGPELGIGSHLVGRCARLWSLSRPWQSPLELRIPDDAAVHCSWQVAADELPPGNYRLQILVLDTWLPVESTRPAKECPNCVDVVLGSASDLEEYTEQLPRTFQGFLERLLLAASGAARISAMQQMAEHFEETDVPFALDVLLQLAEEWGAERLFSSENRNVIELLQVLLLDPPHQLLQTVAARVVAWIQHNKTPCVSCLSHWGSCHIGCRLISGATSLLLRSWG